MTLAWALIIIFAVFLIWKSGRGAKIAKVIGWIVLLVGGGLGLLVWIMIRQSDAQRQARLQWEWDHYTGYRLTLSDEKLGLYFDKKAGDYSLCTTMGYPGYPACPPQQYVVNGQPAPQPGAGADLTWDEAKKQCATAKPDTMIRIRPRVYWLCSVVLSTDKEPPHSDSVK